MNTRLNPYLHFKSNTREAMEFYQHIFGGKLDITTYQEGQMSEDPVEGKKIMHAMLEADNGIVFMASDTPEGIEVTEGGTMAMSLSGDNETELKGYWEKLAQGAKIVMPLDKAPWGDSFGMLHDKFGIEWMVNISPAKSS